MDDSRKSQAYHVQSYVDGDTIQNDVTVRISDGRLREIEAGCSTDAIKLGDVILIPGLVNAHTHLEFSLLREPISTAGRFTDWIRSVVSYRREHPRSAQAILAGVNESLRAGTTLIGDIATTGWSNSDYLSVGFAGVIFQELLGLGDERVASQIALAHEIAANHDQSEVAFSFGLSPHAPYSVHPDLFRAAVAAANQYSRPLAIHLAETEAEIELLAEGTGEFREMLTQFGIWREGLFGGRRSLDFLKAMADCPRALVVHGNYLDDEELLFLAKHPNLTLVYCPRTHAAFGHREHPWRRLLELGGAVALGTDSRASNPDLSLFAELQFLAARYPDLSHLELLKLGTCAGRVALQGNAADLGRADFCAVECVEHGPFDPAKSVCRR